VEEKGGENERPTIRQLNSAWEGDKKKGALCDETGHHLFVCFWFIIFFV